MNNTQADDEFDPSSTPSGAPAGSTNSSAEFGPGFDDEFDSEVNFKSDAGSAGGGEKGSVPSPTIADNASDKNGGPRVSLRAMLSKGTGLRVSGAAGLLESIAAQIAVPGTPLHERIEKKSSALIGSLGKLVATDPDFKVVCAKFAENFESLKGAGLKSAVLKFLDSLQDTFELTDDQAAICVLLTATASLRKRADKSKTKAALTLRILGSVVSADSDCEMDSRIKLVASGDLIGDLTGGDRANVALFKTPSSFTIRLFVAWVDHLSRLSEHDSSLAEERKKFFMTAGTQHVLWQQVVDKRLEHILLCWARFDEAKQEFARFQQILNVQLLPADVYGIVKLFWPAIHPELIEEMKNASRLWSIAGKSVSWLEGVPVFPSFERSENSLVMEPCYRDFFEMTWNLWTANGDRQVVKVNPRQMLAAPPAGSDKAPRSGKSSDATPKKDRPCFHFKKHGSCKFGGDEGCRNGTHPAEFKSAGGLPAPVPKVDVALAAGVVVGDDLVERECRMCKKQFSESQNEWFVEKKLEAMPWHCDACRQLRHKQRKEAAAKSSAASPAAIVLSQAPAAAAPVPAAAAPVSAAPSIGVPLVQPAQASNVSESSWNEIVEFGDAEDFFFMISEPDALQDIAIEYGESGDEDFKDQIADEHFHRCWLGKLFSMWAPLMKNSVRVNDVSFFKAAVNPGAPGHLLRAADDNADSYAVPSSDGQGETLEQLNSPCPWILASASDDDADPSDDDGQIVCSPSWASLNNHNLAAKSMTMKAKFNGDALHDDRIRIHQGINRSIQLCVTDSQGRLLAVPSEDGIEICLPGISLDLDHFSLDLLPSMLFEQTALSSEVSDFKYRGVVELCDDFGDKQSWYYFEIAVSDGVAATASDEEGNAVSWLEAWQWRTMNELRAAEASCFFDFKNASDQRGIVVEPLGSEEFEYAMGSSPDLHTEEAAVDSPEEFLVKMTRNKYSVLSSDEEDCLDQFISKHGGIESVNADNSPDSHASGNDQLEFIHSRFGDILPLVLEHAVLQDFSVLMFSKSRSWLVRQPSAKKVIKKILADKELRTPVKVIETLAKLVPFAVELIRVGVSPEFLAAELAADHGDDKLFQDFHLFDYEVVVAASLDLSGIVIEKQFQFAATALAGVSSELCLVCSGLRSDIKKLADNNELLASARKLGMPKQLTLRECISRASESVMFGDPSYRFVKKLIRGDTALDQVNSESMPFFGAGSTEPRQ